VSEVEEVDGLVTIMSRHQGWFPYFSAGQVGRQVWQKGVQRKALLLKLSGFE